MRETEERERHIFSKSALKRLMTQLTWLEFLAIQW